MTKEQAIKAIKEHCYFANLVPIAKEALDMAIKALEQQPSEDCVSRQAVNELFDNEIKMYEERIETRKGSNYHDETERIKEFRSRIANVEHWQNKIKSLPPVTPTHGTCKDCKHFHNVRKDFNTCDLWTIACTDNHYCADYEKRGLIK